MRLNWSSGQKNEQDVRLSLVHNDPWTEVNLEKQDKVAYEKIRKCQGINLM